MKPRDISVALHIPSMSGDDAGVMMDWIEASCQGRVASDTRIQDIKVYRTEFLFEGPDTHCFYMFFEDPRDAMLFKLRWPARNWEPDMWRWIFVGSQALATLKDGQYVVDTRVLHVR